MTIEINEAFHTTKSKVKNSTQYPDTVKCHCIFAMKHFEHLNLYKRTAEGLTAESSINSSSKTHHCTSSDNAVSSRWTFAFFQQGLNKLRLLLSQLVIFCISSCIKGTCFRNISFSLFELSRVFVCVSTQFLTR